MTIYEQTKASIRKAIDDALVKAKDKGDLTFESIPDYVIEEPREKEHGDFAVNAAMLLARQAKKAPRQIADAIVAHLNTEGTAIASCGLISRTSSKSISPFATFSAASAMYFARNPILRF